MSLNDDLNKSWHKLSIKKKVLGTRTEQGSADKAPSALGKEIEDSWREKSLAEKFFPGFKEISNSLGLTSLLRPSLDDRAVALAAMPVSAQNQGIDQKIDKDQKNRSNPFENYVIRKVQSLNIGQFLLQQEQQTPAMVQDKAAKQNNIER